MSNDRDRDEFVRPDMTWMDKAGEIKKAGKQLAHQKRAEKAEEETNKPDKISSGRISRAELIENTHMTLAADIKKELSGLKYLTAEDGEHSGWVYYHEGHGWRKIHIAEMKNYKISKLFIKEDAPGRISTAVKEVTGKLLGLTDSIEESSLNDPAGWVMFKSGELALNVHNLKLEKPPKDVIILQRLGIEAPSEDKLDSIKNSRPYDYATDNWSRWMEQWLPDKETRQALFELIGQALLGNPAERFLVLYGQGANGKSTFTQALLRVFAEYAITLPVDVFAREYSGGQSGYSLSRIPGKRMAVAPEPPTSSRWNESLIKSLTGHDEMMVREIYKPHQAIKPALVPIVHTNTRPRLSDTGESMKRRMIMVPFEQVIPEADRIAADLMSKLLDEALPDVFLDVIAGLWRYQEQTKHGGWYPSTQMIEAQDEYFMMENVLAQIIETYTEESSTPGQTVTATSLFQVAKADDASVMPNWWTQIKLSRQLAESPDYETVKIRRRYHIQRRCLSSRATALLDQLQT